MAKTQRSRAVAVKRYHLKSYDFFSFYSELKVLKKKIHTYSEYVNDTKKDK